YGINYNLSQPNYYIDFTKIDNVILKDNVKKYIKRRLLGGRKFSWGTALIYLTNLPLFLNFLATLEPEWNDLKELSREHIEKYLEFIRSHANNVVKNKNGNVNKYVRNNVSCIFTFLQDIQRLEDKIAPEKPTKQLLYPEDVPPQEKKPSNNIDHIPDYVLEQLFENIDNLHPDAQAIVWVAFKTGLRISDVLGLTQDCLVRLNGKYSIQTDIEKVYVKNHRIPIDNHLADILAALIHLSKEQSNNDNNPNRFIFVRYRGSRKGKPISQAWVRTKFNTL
ncbi:transposase, partial [Terribacillus saccharophilus]|uniref:tyrosine-type recombinase/integrase n=1 Tax=Terribacillus saccharophilus TaxID=361277 RepID=UPI000BCC8FE2